MKTRTRSATSLAAGALAVGLGLLVAPAATAYAPASQTIYTPNTSTCNKSQCVLYPKSAQLPSGRLIMAFEDSEGPVVGQTLPIYKSDDNGDTWQKLTSIKAPAAVSSDSQYAGLTSHWTNPYFYVLPADLGQYKKGTVLLASLASSGTSSNNNRLFSAIVLWASSDNGATWNPISKIAGSPTQYPASNDDTAYADPVWEPYLMMRNGQLVAYFSDEREAFGYDSSTGVVSYDPNDATTANTGNQILAHSTWSGSGAWSAPVVDVAGATTTNDGVQHIGGDRPGMTNVVPTTDGKWMMTFEYYAGGDNRFKVADDPLKFYAAGGAGGTSVSSLPVASGSGKLATGGSPVLVRRPDGGLIYNAANSGSVWVNESGRSDGTWKEYQTSVPGGYSRNLQYVDATGRIQILQASWQTGPVRGGQVDLGHSAGAYYTLVNRATGQALSTAADKTQDANKTGNVPDIITWADNPANDTQRWHAEVKGSNTTFLNKAGGRALGIWQGSTTPGTQLAQWVDDGGADKQWTLVTTSDGYVKIRSTLDTSLYITGSGSNGAVQVQKAVDASSNAAADDAQEWKLVKQ